MIRLFENKDLDSLSELYASVFESPPWNETWEVSWAHERLKIILYSPGFSGFVFESESNLLGAVMGRGNSFKGKKELEILELFVSSKVQSKGIGSRLLSAIETNAKDLGYAYSVLLTSNRTPAFEFYSHNGYAHSKEMAFLRRAL